MDAFDSTTRGLNWHNDDAPVEPFAFTGINGRLEALGDVWEFWECPGCGNATFSEPKKCEKCNGISFEFIRLWGNQNDRRRAG